MLAVILKWYKILLHESSVTFECVRMLLNQTTSIISSLSIVPTIMKIKYEISNINSGLQQFLNKQIFLKMLLYFTVFILKEIYKQNQGSAQQSILSQLLCWNDNNPFQNRIPSAAGKLLPVVTRHNRTVALKYKGWHFKTAKSNLHTKPNKKHNLGVFHQFLMLVNSVYTKLQ